MTKKIYYGIIISVLLLSAYACNQQTNGEEKEISPDVVTNTSTADTTAAKVGTPAIAFEKDTFDFGKIREGQKVSHDFKFTNTGDADLVISDASATCGCTVPEYPKDPVAPGETGIIKVEFNSTGKEGMQNKSVTIFANTEPNTAKITIKGEVTKNK